MFAKQKDSVHVTIHDYRDGKRQKPARFVTLYGTDADQVASLLGQLPEKPVTSKPARGKREPATAA